MVGDVANVPAASRWPRAIPESGWRTRLPLAVALAFVFHGAISLVLIVDDRVAPATKAPTEPIAVEIVEEPTAEPQPKPEPQADTKPQAAAQPESAQPVPPPEPAPPPEPQPPAPPEPDVPPAPQVDAKTGPSNVGPPPPQVSPEEPLQLRAALTPPEPAPDAVLPSEPQAVAPPAAPIPRPPLFTLPETILSPSQDAVGRPLAEEGSAEGDAYKGTVFGMLEQVKQYPDAAKRRQESGVVIVTFAVDDSGRPQDIALVRSSGHATLDREALAMVRRAAPFPPPPPNAPRQFGPAITFRLR